MTAAALYFAWQHGRVELKFFPWYVKVTMGLDITFVLFQVFADLLHLAAVVLT